MTGRGVHTLDAICNCGRVAVHAQSFGRAMTTAGRHDPCCFSSKRRTGTSATVIATAETWR